MANDRIFIRCKSCGVRMLLARYYPTGSFVYPDGEDLDAYLETHLGACRGYPSNPAGDPGLELLTEEEPHESTI